MLHTQTVLPSTLELLNKLMDDSMLRNFVLVGGTSLALQLGHRLSVDLDLFTNTSFEEQRLAEYLISEYGLELDFIAKETVKGEIAGVQIDCIAHRYPWVKPFVQEDKIRLASFADIAAMKLNAISGNGTRVKDFIDVAYLSSMMSLNDMLDAYELKYRVSPLIPLKSISFWDDINFDEPIKMLDSSFNWKRIAKRLQDMQNKPRFIFSKL